MQTDEKKRLVRDLSRGLFGWYDFNKNRKILYIGEKEDAFAGFFIDGGYDHDTVPVSEISEEWAEQHKSMYSYAVCISALETSAAPLKVLGMLKKTLESDGHLLLGMNNRLGLRYFCGDRDPYTDGYFDGIENYAFSGNSPDISGRCYSKEEIREIIDQAGFERKRFFSVLPDLNTASFIFADDYTPNEDLSNRVFPAYNDPGSVYMKEQSLYPSLIKEGLFHLMANAFLIECTVSGDLSDVKQVTASPDRGKENALYTVIRGNDTVEKRAMYPEGVKKLRKMKDNEEDLKAHGIKIIDSSLDNDVYKMPFENSPLAQVYLKELLYKDKDKFLSEMDRFHDTVLKSSEKRVLDDGTEVFKKGYLDLVPLNSFVKDGEFYFIDQEFFAEDLPVKVMSMRQIESFYFGDPAIEKEFPRAILYERYGIMEERVRWSKIECDFIDGLLNKDALSDHYKKIRTDDALILKRRREMDSRLINIFKGTEGKEVYLFGSGKYADRFLDIYGRDIPVRGILDNDNSKTGSKKRGISIFSPDILRDKDKDSIKIIVCIRDHQAIVRQIKDLGITDFSIFDPEILSVLRPRTTVLIEKMEEVPHEKHYHTGYVAGAFDMFHIGHLNLLRRAKERCDYLIAGVMSDERMYDLKKKYPVIPCSERMKVVAGCRYVDQVEELPIDRAGISDAYHMFHFDCMFSGDDHADNPAWLAERENLRSMGSDIVFVPYTKDTSSSEIRDKIQKEN